MDKKHRDKKPLITGRVKLPRRSDYSKLLALLQGALADERMPQGVPGTFDLTVKEGEAYFLPQPSQ